MKPPTMIPRQRRQKTVLIAVDVYGVGWAPSAEFVVVEDLFSPRRWLEGLYRTLGESVDLILSSCPSLDFLQTK
jgi:hypothetical protein